MGYEHRTWSYWCFLGFAPNSAQTIDDFDPEEVQSLLRHVGVESAVASLSPIDPRHLINQKGATVWLVLYFLVLANDQAGLQAAAEGHALLLVPPDILRPAFSSHVNWPERLLNRYRLEPRGAHPFVLPFLVHTSAPRLQPLQRSLRAPDGAVEIWGVVEFNQSEPEKLLWEIQRLTEHIDRESGGLGESRWGN